MAERRLKDIDAAARTQRLHAKIWAFAVAFVGGIPVGGGIAILSGGNPILGAVLGFLLAFGIIYFGTTAMADRTAAAVGKIYHPSGSSTPPRREYSRAEALVKRGLYDEAVIAYETHCAEYPEDGEPYFRLARLYRDHLNKPDEAVTWFLRARTTAKLSDGQELLVTQELVELYTRRLDMPRKAIPELSAICKRFSGTPAAEAAERELAGMRRMLAEEHEGGARFSEQYRAQIDAREEDRNP